jgi:hypothetical protein
LYRFHDPATPIKVGPRGTIRGGDGLYLAAGGQREEIPMDEYTKTEIWDLAAGTFIAVSVVSSMAFIIASAIH